MNAIERLRDVFRGMSRDILAERVTVEFAAGLLEAAGELLRPGEHLVWNRDGCLHTDSITDPAGPESALTV